MTSAPSDVKSHRGGTSDNGSATLKVAALFAGIWGIEVGLHRSGHRDLAEGIAKLAKLHGAAPNRGTLWAQSAERAGYVAVAKTQKPLR